MDLHVRGNGPVHRALDLEIVVLLLEIKGVRVHDRGAGDDAFDVVLYAVVVLEGDRSFFVAQVLDRDLEPLVQERLAFRYIEDVLVIEAGLREDLGVRAEIYPGAVRFGRLSFFEISLWFAA